MSKKKLHYFVINKPYGYLSQFSNENGNQGLGELFKLPKDVYPVGRLDRDSEGLLILTNDKRINSLLLNPLHKHNRSYLIEVEGDLTPKNRNDLENGIELNFKGKRHKTLPCKIENVEGVELEERSTPVNRIKHPLTSWEIISLVEGKNRQVRKMLAKVGHPVLRLIRVRIENLELEELKSGDIKQISQNTLFKSLKLDHLMLR